MQPRVLFRTHYQVDEPAFAKAVVVQCTSPITSSYDDTVAAKLSRYIQARQKNFNVAAAGYAVDLAHGLSLLNSNNVWDENGHLVNLVARDGDGPWENDLSLTLAEKLLYFRLFLEADGAALGYLSRRFLVEGQLPCQESDWNTLAKEMFTSTYSEYLTLTAPTADRVRLRSQRDRIDARGYKGKTGSHKLFLHLQTLHRLDLIERVSGSNERKYRLTSEWQSRLNRFVDELPDAQTLETAIREHRHIEIAARVFGLNTRNATLGSRQALRELLPAYVQVMKTGVAICPLAPIIEATQISLLCKSSQLVGYRDFLDTLAHEQARHVRDIRFHQNRLGQPAFLRISEKLIQDMLAKDEQLD